jgi:hypothetical protein
VVGPDALLHLFDMMAFADASGLLLPGCCLPCTCVCRLSGVGGPDALPNLVDVMAFAALSRGGSQEEVGDMVAAAIRSSVEKGTRSINQSINHSITHCSSKRGYLQAGGGGGHGGGSHTQQR